MPKLVIPVSAGGRPIGRLELDERHRARPYGDRTADLLRTTGERLGEALADLPERPVGGARASTASPSLVADAID